MRCAEKEKLQRNCTAAWDAYASMVKESGLPVDGQSANMKLPSTSELVAWRSERGMSLSGAVAGALRLRGDHLRASHALSTHLSQHRC